jgi:hypothetical protein
LARYCFFMNTKMMRCAAAAIATVVLTVCAFAAPATPVTAGQFIGRCKSDARFCRIQIMAIEEVLEKSRKACLPASVTKETMTARVQDTIGDIVEEDPSLKTGPYRQFVEQIITFLWPCEPIS